MSAEAEEIWAIVRENNIQLEKLRVFQIETSEQMRITDEKMRLTGEQMRKTDEKMRITDEQLRKTDEKLNRIGEMVNGIGKNQGFVAEEFFFNSLVDDPHLGSIHFDDIAKNEFKHRGNAQEEYDILMTNGDAVGIIEVKYKAHEKDLDKLERKMRVFKTLYPLYEKYQLYGAIASFHIYEDAKKAALERGFFVLQRKGKVVTTETAEHLLVL